MIDFPNSPTLNQVYLGSNGVSYTWNGTLWLVQNTFGGGTGDFCAQGTLTFPAVAAFTTLIPTTIVSGNSSIPYSISTGRYTPPAGRYALYASASVANASTPSNIFLKLRKNGTDLQSVVDTGPAANNSGMPSVSAIVDANGTDFFDIQGAQSAATSSTGFVVFQAFPLTGMQGPMGPSGSMLVNGTGAPTSLTAAKGTLYINTTATTTTTRLYINTDGGTTWANFTASA